MTTKRIEAAKAAFSTASRAMHEQRMGGAGSIAEVRAQVRALTHLSESGQAAELQRRLAPIATANITAAREFRNAQRAATKRIEREQKLALAKREAATNPARVAMLQAEYAAQARQEPIQERRAQFVERTLADAVARGDVDSVRALRITGAEILKDTGRSTGMIDRAWNAMLPEEVRATAEDLGELEVMSNMLASRAYDVEAALDDQLRQGEWVTPDERGQPSPMREVFTATHGRTQDEIDADLQADREIESLSVPA